MKIGKYPTFYYNAKGGGGIGICERKNDNSSYDISFNPRTFSIPSINSDTTKLLGLPLFPGLEIKIHPIFLKGVFDKTNNQISLQFDARFKFTIFSIIHAPDLIVKTLLISHKVKSKEHEASGYPLKKNGNVKLVGISIVPRTGNILLDTFLFLPSEALAILNCRLIGL
ncbi:hypothetical protein [Prochlorococcus sp. MIT 1307]|uniref:hypothetical protein n=1 Tax=Prochlorococcus sp. MIT 1307 TaxID=3096219 RepID=UPI002A758BC9|nr:hypothetical protein [Prochlorococcus sp. MIT 1307]